LLTEDLVSIPKTLTCACGAAQIPAPQGSTETTRFTCRKCCADLGEQVRSPRIRLAAQTMIGLKSAGRCSCNGAEKSGDAVTQRLVATFNAVLTLHRLKFPEVFLPTFHAALPPKFVPIHKHSFCTFDFQMSVRESHQSYKLERVKEGGSIAWPHPSRFWNEKKSRAKLECYFCVQESRLICAELEQNLGGHGQYERLPE
jgi:hypothetical protein